jgi:elongation factor P
MFFEEKPIGLDLPIKMELKVTETAPGVKGDSATGGTKTATLETGLAVNVPLFIKEGDTIRVDTRNGNYVERASQ